MYDYMILHSQSQGYALLVRANGFWQQCTKWYWYLGNLKRFHPEAKGPCLYRETH